MPDQIVPADFESIPNNQLTLVLGADELPLEIAKISRLPETSVRAEPFSLTLRHNGASGYLPQGVYTIRHPLRGELQVFTVPIGPDANGMLYEIIFN